MLAQTRGSTPNKFPKGCPVGALCGLPCGVVGAGPLHVAAVAHALRLAYMAHPAPEPPRCRQWVYRAPGCPLPRFPGLTKLVGLLSLPSACSPCRRICPKHHTYTIFAVLKFSNPPCSSSRKDQFRGKHEKYVALRYIYCIYRYIDMHPLQAQFLHVVFEYVHLYIFLLCTLMCV